MRGCECGWCETQRVLADPDEAAAIDEGIAQLDAGDVVDGPTVLSRYLARASGRPGGRG